MILNQEKKIIHIDGRKVAVGIPKEGADGFSALIPLGRAGTPEEAADMPFPTWPDVILIDAEWAERLLELFFGKLLVGNG